MNTAVDLGWNPRFSNRFYNAYSGRFRRFTRDDNRASVIARSAKHDGAISFSFVCSTLQSTHFLFDTAVWKEGDRFALFGRTTNTIKIADATTYVTHSHNL